MLVIDTDARPARGAVFGIKLRLFKLLARRKRPARTPHDYREMERFRAELELKRAQAQILSRFKIM
jgi:hypothetical protein